MKYWLWLTNLQGLTLRDQTLLLRHFGEANEVYFAGGDLLSHVEGLSQSARRALEDKSLDTADRILSACYEKHIQIITMQDAAYPNRLRAIDQPPPVLYCQGRMLPFDAQPVVAVVGTRRATAYGIRSAKRLGYQIGRCGGTLVSGMALGIDAAAMEGALSAGAPVAGVLGCGVDVVYPAENRALFRDVAQWGCLLSEYPPGTRPEGRHFPVRNRILSALSLGVLVVEAPQRSGALITASHALEQGRDVFAVPGDINRPSSAGCNARIRQGAAELVQEPADILAQYQLADSRIQRTLRPVKQASIQEMPREKERKKLLRRLEGSEEERTVWCAVHDGQETVDAIVEKTGLPAASVLTALTMLEVGQYVAATESGYQAAADVEL